MNVLKRLTRNVNSLINFLTKYNKTRTDIIKYVECVYGSYSSGKPFVYRGYLFKIGTLEELLAYQLIQEENNPVTYRKLAKDC